MAKGLSAPAGKPGASVGDNSLDTDTFRIHLRKIVAQKAVVDAEKVKLNALREDARHVGVKLGKLDKAVKRGSWTPEEVREDIEEDIQYAKWVGSIPEGVQLDLLDGVPLPARTEIDWYHRGLTAATTGTGVVGTPPDECPADQVQTWMRGWNDGQEKNAKPLGKPN